MEDKDAFYLLFEKDYGKGSLFKNQIDLVNELVNSPASSYFIFKNDSVNYNKAISRLKAYISQLFSEEATRKITLDFKYSLESLLTQKLEGLNYNPKEIVNLIIEGLQERNNTIRHFHSSNSRKTFRQESDFFENLLEAKHITVFTPREINIEFNILNRKQTFVDLLLENLFHSIKENKQIKRFRFNFPLENTCILFWRGLERAILKYSENDDRFIGSIIPLLIQPNEHFSIKNNYINHKIVNRLLQFISENKIVSVFHLTAPVYLTPSIALNPNDTLSTHVYLVLQTTTGEDNIQKLSNQEVFSWRYFVWDYLKINNSGKEVSYSKSL